MILLNSIPQLALSTLVTRSVYMSEHFPRCKFIVGVVCYGHVVGHLCHNINQDLAGSSHERGYQDSCECCGMTRTRNDWINASHLQYPSAITTSMRAT